MKHITVFLFFLSFGVGSAQNFWEKTNFPTDGSSLYSVHSMITNSDDHLLAGTFAKGIFKSTDNGNNWTESGLTNHWVISFAKDIAGNIFTASIGSQFGSGVFKSIDEGSNWDKVWDTQTGINCIYVDYNQYIYVGLNYFESSGGIFRSTDNGTTWNQLFNLPENVFSIIRLISGRILAACYGKVYYSDNEGSTWNSTITGLVNFTPSALVIKNQNEIFLSTLGYGIYKSTDNGISWVNKTGAGYEYSCLVLNQEGTLFAGTKGNWVYKSSNNGDDWTLLNSGMGEDKYVLSLVVSGSGYLYAGMDYYGLYKSINKVVTSFPDEINKPLEFILNQNYPNPFNPSTKIKYTVGDAYNASPVLVRLVVYDILGNEITTLVNEYKPAGSYEVEFSAIGGSASGGNAYNLSSGVYYFKLSATPIGGQAGSFINTKKMLMLK